MSTPRIRLIEPRGFCFGVEKALTMVEDVVKHATGKPIFVFNEIVHNKTIVDDLIARGVTFTQDISMIPDDAVVVFSAHGVPPQVRQRLQHRGIKIVDATCPLVQKVHDEVNIYVGKGYHIIYIGDEKHDEARAVIAEQPDQISVIKDVNDIPTIKKGHNKYMVLTQTTLNMFEVEKLFQILKATFQSVEFPKKKDICYATTSRQKAVQDAAPDCDLLLVLGSRNSSNSTKLRDIAREAGCQAELIDSYKEIDPLWIVGKQTICVTAGASAPEYLVKKVVKTLEERLL